MFMPQQYHYTKLWLKSVWSTSLGPGVTLSGGLPLPFLRFLESLKLFNKGDKNLPQIKASSAIYSTQFNMNDQTVLCLTACNVLTFRQYVGVHVHGNLAG